MSAVRGSAQKPQKEKAMGSYEKVVGHDLQPMPIEALAVFRQQATAFVENNNSPDYARFIAKCLDEEPDDFKFLQRVAGNEYWSAYRDERVFTLSPTSEGVKGGVEHGFVDWLCPYVDGYIQLYSDWDDNQHRVVWKDGREGRHVQPVWPDPE